MDSNFESFYMILQMSILKLTFMDLHWASQYSMR